MSHDSEYERIGGSLLDGKQRARIAAQQSNLARVEGESDGAAAAATQPPGDPSTPRKDMPLLVAVVQSLGPEPPVMHACVRLCDYEDMVAERNEAQRLFDDAIERHEDSMYHDPAFQVGDDSSLAGRAQDGDTEETT